ncbi:MAG TPA: hypothetical protein VFN91_11315, partial [Myxococcaceae bacterium]|nr:hypothetical protein [Myxococcaceae bacterium]
SFFNPNTPGKGATIRADAERCILRSGIEGRVEARLRLACVDPDATPGAQRCARGNASRYPVVADVRGQETTSAEILVGAPRLAN